MISEDRMEKGVKDVEDGRSEVGDAAEDDCAASVLPTSYIAYPGSILGITTQQPQQNDTNKSHQSYSHERCLTARDQDAEREHVVHDPLGSRAPYSCHVNNSLPSVVVLTIEEPLNVYSDIISIKNLWLAIQR